MVEKNTMTRLLIAPFHLLATEISKKMVALSETIYKKSDRDPLYKTLEEAGSAQWDGFSLKSTPDIRKKGVTDISKYYA